MNDLEIDFALSLANTETIDQAKHLFARKLATFGVERFIYGVLPRDAHGRILDVLSIDTLDPDWMAFYTENDLVKADYAAWKSLDGNTPVIFDDMFRNIDSGKIDGVFKRTADFSRDWNMRNGVTVPIKSHGRVGAAISLLFRDDVQGRQYLETFLHHKVELMTAVHTFHAHIDTIAFAQDYYGIMAREGEVLSWLADGLLAKEIAHKTGTSVHTIQKQIASAKTRLRAATATQAVAKAIYLKVI